MIVCLMLSLLLLQMMMKMMMMTWFGLVQGIPCFQLAAKRQTTREVGVNVIFVVLLVWRCSITVVVVVVVVVDEG